MVSITSKFGGNIFAGRKAYIQVVGFAKIGKIRRVTVNFFIQKAD